MLFLSLFPWILFSFFLGLSPLSLSPSSPEFPGLNGIPYFSGMCLCWFCTPDTYFFQSLKLACPCSLLSPTGFLLYLGCFHHICCIINFYYSLSLTQRVIVTSVLPGLFGSVINSHNSLYINSQQIIIIIIINKTVSGHYSVFRIHHNNLTSIDYSN